MKVEIEKLRIKIEIRFFSFKIPSAMLGLIYSQLRILPESPRAKILKPVGIGLLRIVIFCVVLSLNLSIISLIVRFIKGS
jgi:hypothetical protein